MRRRISWLGWPLLLLGCASSEPAVEDRWPPELPPGSFQLERHDERWEVLARATLQRVDRPDAPLRLVGIEPAERAGDHAWVWCHLDTGERLTLPDGSVEAHPDLDAIEELRGGLAATPPDVEGVLAGLRRLRRYESRAKLLSELPPVDGLASPSRAALLDAITRQRQALVLGPGPDGCPPGGSGDDALLPALLAFAGAGELAPAEAEALLQAGLELSSSSARRRVLEELRRGREPFTVSRLVRAAASLSNDDRHALLLSLARRQELAPAEARTVLAAGLAQDYTSQREAVLRALIGAPAAPGRVFGVAEILANLGPISRDTRAQVTLELARQEIDAADARRVLAAGLALDYTSERQAVLRALIGPQGGSRELLSVEQILAALTQVSRDGRAALVLELARRETLGGTDVGRVLAAGLALDYTSEREAVLRALMGAPRAPRPLLGVEQVLRSLSQLSSDARAAITLELAGRGDISRADARRVLATGLALDYTSQREAVLRALVGPPGRSRGLLDVSQVLDSLGQLSSDKRYEHLLELARGQLTREEAERVLAAGVAQDYTSQRRPVVVALVGKASRERIAAAAQQLDREGEREVLKALAGLKGE